MESGISTKALPVRRSLIGRRCPSYMDIQLCPFPSQVPPFNRSQSMQSVRNRSQASIGAGRKTVNTRASMSACMVVWCERCSRGRARSYRKRNQRCLYSTNNKVNAWNGQGQGR